MSLSSGFLLPLLQFLRGVILGIGVDPNKKSTIQILFQKLQVSSTTSGFFNALVKGCSTYRIKFGVWVNFFTMKSVTITTAMVVGRVSLPEPGMRGESSGR